MTLQPDLSYPYVTIGVTDRRERIERRVALGVGLVCLIATTAVIIGVEQRAISRLVACDLWIIAICLSSATLVKRHYVVGTLAIALPAVAFIATPVFTQPGAGVMHATALLLSAAALTSIHLLAFRRRPGIGVALVAGSIVLLGLGIRAAP